MKKRFLLFSFVLFFATLCAGLLAHKTEVNSYPDTSLKNNFQQQSNHQSHPEIYNISDLQDSQDANDVEKIKFDYSVVEQEWLSYFFSDCSFNIPVAAVQNRIYISAPRYILYHSLQIAGC